MRDNTFSKKVFIKTVSDNLKNKYRKTIEDATQQELYQAVSEAVKDVIMDEWIATQRVMDKDDPKVVYYMSMEFLMGRALGNNHIRRLRRLSMKSVWISMPSRTRSRTRHLETADLEDWQHASWIHLPHSDILHTAVESDTDMVCSSSRFQTASR